MRKFLGVELGPWFGHRSKAVTVTASPQLVETIRMLDGTPASYGNVYRRLQPVRTVVDFLADAVSTTSLKVYRREGAGRPELYDHPLAVLLRNPNPEMTQKRLLSDLVHDLAIYGNAYWWKLERRGVRWIVPVPPSRVEPVGGDLLAPAGYDVLRVDTPIPKRIPREQMVHFHSYDPEDRRIGSSKLAALRTVLLEEIEASTNRVGFWKNHARPGIVITRPKEVSTLSEEAERRVLSDFDNRYSKAANSGRSAMLQEGMAPAALEGFSPKDAEFVAGRLFVLEATCRVYNVPLPLLGLTESVAYSSQREHHKALYQDTLPPWYETIQSEIELQLLPWFEDTDDVYVEFNPESKLWGDPLDKLEYLDKAIGRPVMLVEEGRSLLNLTARPGSDDDRMVVPVGPNLALEGSEAEEEAEEPPQLAAAAALGAELERFFTRQTDAIRSRVGAGRDDAFDTDRWVREMKQLLGMDNGRKP